MAFRGNSDKKMIFKTKPCRYCINTDLVIDYKNAQLLAEHLTERGKIVAGRVTGTCRYHQGQIVEAVKRARQVALLPYTITHAIRV